MKSSYDHRRSALDHLLASKAERLCTEQQDLLARDEVRRALLAEGLCDQASLDSITSDRLKRLGKPFSADVALALKAAFPGAAQGGAGGGGGAAIGLDLPDAELLRLGRAMATLLMTGGAPSDSAASSDTPLKTSLMETLSSVKAGPCGDEIYCMVTHQHQPRRVVTGAHLLPRAWNTLNKTLFGFADIDDVRNGVLMLGVIARACARFQLCLVPQLVPPLSYAIVVHVLDPDLRNKTLVSALPQVRLIA
eukprot:TRINITY_DN4465_c0_g2_i1.p1 TRINITY_DN4465_c0_g2~~TRINITY_DN4465_c0_g2_i1.p1  ORF type:complete len:250 (-),score=35.87 TRINITY_DN4465_c0_g2_i1:1228-1977(-)